MKLAHYLKQKKKVFLCSLIAGMVMPYFTCFYCRTEATAYATVAAFTFSIWVAMWLGVEALTHWLDEKIGWTRTPVLRLVTGIFATAAYAVTMALLLKFCFEFLSGMILGDVRIMIYSTLFFTLGITFFLTSRAFLLNWRQTSIDAEQLKKESIAAQYESLKNQVNPHFLFNSFNVLSNLVYEDQDKAVKFIKQLSDVYRYVLDSRMKEMVSLDEELHFLRSYIYLQQIRFGDKLKVEVELDGVNSYVAPLALQLLVENAIKHNVVSHDDPLTIRIFSSGDSLVVENNLQVKQGISEDSSGIGLENIEKRYSFLSGRKVEILKSQDYFTVKLPLI